MTVSQAVDHPAALSIFGWVAGIGTALAVLSKLWEIARYLQQIESLKQAEERREAFEAEVRAFMMASRDDRARLHEALGRVEERTSMRPGRAPLEGA